MSTFTWTPDYSAQKSIEPKVSKIQFGDGYEHRQANGLNSVLQNWSLRFENRASAEADEIDTFLTDRAALDSFDWTPPDAGSPLKFVCRSWVRSIDHAGLYSISTAFEQVAEP